MKNANQQERWCGLPAMFVTFMAMVMFAGQASAQGNAPERRPMWYEDTVVSGLITPNDPAVPHIPNDLPEHILQPLYFIVK